MTTLYRTHVDLWAIATPRDEIGDNKIEWKWNMNMFAAPKSQWVGGSSIKLPIGINYPEPGKPGSKLLASFEGFRFDMPAGFEIRAVEEDFGPNDNLGKVRKEDGEIPPDNVWRHVRLGPLEPDSGTMEVHYRVAKFEGPKQ